MNKGISNAVVLVIVVGLVVVLLGGLVWYAGGPMKLFQRQDTSDQSAIIVGDATPTPVSITLDNEGFNTLAMQRDDLPVGGEVLEEQEQLVTAVDGKSQVMFIRSFDGSSFNLTVISDLAGSTGGNMYRVWLVKPADETDRVDAGTLVMKAGKYAVAYNSPHNLTEFKKIIVTSQAEAETEMGPVVAEAMFE